MLNCVHIDQRISQKRFSEYLSGFYWSFFFDGRQAPTGLYILMLELGKTLWD